MKLQHVVLDLVVVLDVELVPVMGGDDGDEMSRLICKALVTESNVVSFEASQAFSFFPVCVYVPFSDLPYLFSS